MMERPTTPMGTVSLSLSIEGSPPEKRASYTTNVTPVTPTRSIKRMPIDEILDENDCLVVPKNTRRPNPSTASTTLRLSTASLGAVRRVGTPTSTTTAACSFYSAAGGDENDRGKEGQCLEDAFEAETEEGSTTFGSVIGNYEDSLSVRRESVDTTMYEGSSAPSSPQRGSDYPFHLSSHLSPPPKASLLRQSPSLIDTPKSPIPIPIPASPPMNKTPLPRSLATSLQSSPAGTTLRQSRARYCTYISLHTGVRCNAPTTQLQTLCPAHLHHSNSPVLSARTSVERQPRMRREDITKAFLSSQSWAPQNYEDSLSPKTNSSPWETPYSRSPARYHSDENLQTTGDILPGLYDDNYSPVVETHVLPPHLFSCHSVASSRSGSISGRDGYLPTLQSLDPSMTLPSTARSGSTGVNYADSVGYPFSYAEHHLADDHVDLDPMIPPNTVIDWKTNESRRREYEEADRRRKGLWGWVRRRIRSLCCVKPEQGEFWEGNKDDNKGDGGSVRRYRLALPEEKEEEIASPIEDIPRGRDRTPCSAPPTAGGTNVGSSTVRRTGRIEGVVMRRASVGGDMGAGWHTMSTGRAPSYSIPILGAKDGLMAVSVLEKVDSYGSYGSDRDTHEYQVHYHRPQENAATTARAGGKLSGKKEKAWSESGGRWRRPRSTTAS